VIGYRPEKVPDGRFHRLTVTVQRPGVVVRARRGYVAALKPPTETARGDRATDPNLPEAVAPPANARAEVHDAAETPGAGEISAAAPASTVPAIRVRPDVEQHVASLGPQAHDPEADAGWDAYKRGDVDAAQRSLSVAVTRPGAAAWMHYALGQSEYALRHFPQAVAAWEKVRTSVPEFEPVYFDLVDGYLQQKEYDKATRVLRDAQKHWPADAEVLNALGVVQVARGSLDDAVESFERAVAAAPSDAVGYFNLGKAAELRYWKSRRYVTQTRQWIANERDRTKAIDNYKRYLALGGPLESAARDGLSRLNWSSP
jgi:tetratricopeptide (TPR) repeat protein